MSEGVRTTGWKYTRYTSVEPPREELFDLERDPLEEHDLATVAAARDQLDMLRNEWLRLAAAAE